MVTICGALYSACRELDPLQPQLRAKPAVAVGTGIGDVLYQAASFTQLGMDICIIGKAIVIAVRVEQLRERDEMYPEAVEIIIREQRGSVSLLQRALGIGYGRGARLIDFMAEDGFVGPYNGSNAREVLLKMEQWEAMKLGETVEAGA